MRETVWNRNFILLCSSNFFVGAIFYMTATVLPLYVQSVLQGDERVMGLVISMYVLGSVLVRIFSGYIVDHFGIKKIGIISFSLFLIVCVAYLGAIHGLLLFFIVRVLHGACYAISSTLANTAVITVLHPHLKSEGIGYFSMFLSISMVIGPSLGLYLWKDGQIEYVLYAVIVMALIALISILYVRHPKLQPTQKNERFSMKEVIEPKAMPFSLLMFCMFFAYSSLASFLAAYTEQLGFSSSAGMYFIVFAVMIVAFRPFVAKLISRYPSTYFFYPSMAGFIVGLVLLSVAANPTMILGSAVIMGISYGVLFPVLQTGALKRVPTQRIGAATATFFLLGDVGYGFGSYFLGVIAAQTNYRFMFICASSVAFIAMIIYRILCHRIEKEIVLERETIHQ